MKAILLTAIFGLCACGQVETVPAPAPTCVTTCGSLVYGNLPYEGFCQDLNLLESITVQQYALAVKEPAFQNACQDLKGLAIYLWEESDHFEADGSSYDGEAFCGDEGIPPELGIGKKPLEEGAYPHEVAHWLERCSTNHENWGDRGINKADWRARVIYANEKKKTVQAVISP